MRGPLARRWVGLTSPPAGSLGRTGMSYLLIAILSVALVALIAWPLVSGRGVADPAPGQRALADAEDDLARSLDAIREIDMDHRAGNLSDEDFAALDADERARAVELMHRRDAIRDAAGGEG